MVGCDGNGLRQGSGRVGFDDGGVRQRRDVTMAECVTVGCVGSGRPWCDNYRWTKFCLAATYIKSMTEQL